MKHGVVPANPAGGLRARIERWTQAGREQRWPKSAEVRGRAKIAIGPIEGICGWLPSPVRHGLCRAVVVLDQPRGVRKERRGDLAAIHAIAVGRGCFATSEFGRDSLSAGRSGPSSRRQTRLGFPPPVAAASGRSVVATQQAAESLGLDDLAGARARTTVDQLVAEPLVRSRGAVALDDRALPQQATEASVDGYPAAASGGAHEGSTAPSRPECATECAIAPVTT